MVPGSTLMYGSSLTIAILRPRASRIAPREAAAMPLPNEDTTPPVTNTKRVIKIFERISVAKGEPRKADERRADKLPQEALPREPSRPALWRSLVNQPAPMRRAGGDLN